MTSVTTIDSSFNSTIDVKPVVRRKSLDISFNENTITNARRSSWKGSYKETYDIRKRQPNKLQKSIIINITDNKKENTERCSFANPKFTRPTELVNEH